MKKFILFICLFLTFTNVFGQDEEKKSKDAATTEAEIRRLEELGRVKSLNGDSNWDDLWGEGAYLIAVFGGVTIYRKGQNLSAGFPPPKSLKMSDVIVRIHAETAVVTALMDIEIETAEKKVINYSVRFMNVWKKFADGWKIIYAQRTAVRPQPK